MDGINNLLPADAQMPTAPTPTPAPEVGPIFPAPEEKPVKKFSFKLILKLFIALVVLGVLGVFGLYAASMLQKNGTPEEVKVEEKKDESVISPKNVASYRINSPALEPVMSFIYYGEPTSFFSSNTAYFLDKDNRLVGLPFFVSADNSGGRAWCQGGGKSAFNISADQSASYCLENISGRNIVIRRLDLKSREYKEYMFEGSSDLFSESKLSRVISSRDGDTAFIYSQAGAFIFEAVSGNLFKVDLPTSLEIIKSVNISNVEAALVTAENKVYRINFSNRRGGVFDVNFIGLSPEQLSKGLKTARLSKDGRRIIFTISDAIESLPADGNINYQSIVAYNIDLGTSKVSDELSYEEKFFVSCKYLVGNKFCVYRNREGEAGRNLMEALYYREFDQPLVAILKVKGIQEGYRMKVETVWGNSNYFFVKSPNFFEPNDEKKFTWVAYTFNTTDKVLRPISY